MSLVREMRARVKAEAIDAGMGPQSSGLLLRTACFRLVSAVQDGGMVEMSKLPARTRELRALREDQEVGSRPVSMLL